MSQGRAPLNILLVEDDLDIAQFLEIMIEATGASFELTHIPRLAQALEQLDSANFDVILLDLVLEDSWGLDTLVAAYARAPRTPIIVLTGYNDEELGARALQQGAQDYLVKGQVDGRILVRSMRYAIERKRADEALHASEARYRALVEHLPLGVYELDRAGRLLSMNPAGLRMVGAEAVEHVRGRSYLDILPSADLTRLSMLASQAYAGETLEIEHTGDIDGQPRIFSTTLSPLADADGAVDQLIGTIQDITEQIQARLDAEVERDRLDAVLESSNDAIIMIDLDSRVRLVNRAFCTFLGVEADQVLGMPGERLIQEYWDYFDRPAEFLRVIEALVEQPQREDSGEVIVLRPLQRVLIWYSRPVRTRADTILGRLFIFRDATREKEADLMKTEFISIVSHELRTPLTSIKGFTDLILDGDAGEISADLREFLEIIKISADQLVEITNDILETSRLESGKIRLNLQPVTIAEIARGVAASIQPIIAAKEQALTIELPPELPQVYADRERLVQVFTNLLSNAHKYTPAQGRISIRAEVVEQGLGAHVAPGASSQAWVVIAIEDSGFGIAPEDQQHLFSRFYRVSTPETQGIGGTGLGLHITRSLVELHGGAIWLESEPGRGSCFFFSVPAIAQQAEDWTDGDGELAAILIVESDPAFARLIQHHLERAGYRARVAASAGAALAVARAEPPALVMLAIHQADQDELTLIEQLQADERTMAVPIIAISDVADAEHTLQLGVAAHLSSSIDERSLIDIVRTVTAPDRRPVALVIDDDARVAQVLAQLLTRHGFNTFTAADGQQGLTLATRLQPSLVLIDLWMADTGGFQVLNILRQHPATRAIPIIALNDSDISPAAISRLLSLGAVELVAKPPEIQALEALIAAKLKQLDLAMEPTRIGHNPNE